MQRKLLEIISVDCGVTGQLLITYSALNISEKKMGIQRTSASATYRVQKSL